MYKGYPLVHPLVHPLYTPCTRRDGTNGVAGAPLVSGYGHGGSPAAELERSAMMPALPDGTTAMAKPQTGW